MGIRFVTINFGVTCTDVLNKNKIQLKHPTHSNKRNDSHFISPCVSGFLIGEKYVNVLKSGVIIEILMRL